MMKKILRITSFIFLWLLYAVIGGLVGYLLFAYKYLELMGAIMVSVGVFIVVAFIIEFLDKKFNWTDSADSKGVLNLQDFLAQPQHQGIGQRKLMRIYAEQGGDIKDFATHSQTP